MKALASIALALLAGAATIPAQTVADFHLPDVNPTSPRNGSTVSPRDYWLQVSGYYFGAAN